jgi:hypothetical protein
MLTDTPCSIHSSLDISQCAQFEHHMKNDTHHQR